MESDRLCTDLMRKSKILYVKWLILCEIGPECKLQFAVFCLAWFRSFQGDYAVMAFFILLTCYCTTRTNGSTAFVCLLFHFIAIYTLPCTLSPFIIVCPYTHLDPLFISTFAHFLHSISCLNFFFSIIKTTLRFSCLFDRSPEYGNKY